MILLIFALGLEFSLRKLIAVGPTAGITGVIQRSLLFWLGYAIALGFGWTTRQAMFTAAIVAISSTTIIAKAFDEQGIRGRLRELVVGVLIVEDLIAILIMATLTAIATGSGLSAENLIGTTGRLVAFLVGLLVVVLLVVPRTVRFVVRLGRDETTLVASVGICFAIALLAYEFGYSVALGAFLAGSLFAESGEVHEVERLVLPVRDVFAAIFFVSVGMLIDPKLLVAYWLPISVLFVAVVVGKIVSVSLGAFFTGNGVHTSIQAGMSLAQIGEFSFIIAGLGLSLRATGDFLYPVAVAVSAITTLTTPWLIRASGPVASAIDQRLPKPLQTFVGLYGSWVEQLGTAPRVNQSRVRRLAGLLLLDAVISRRDRRRRVALSALDRGSRDGSYLNLPETVVSLGVVGIAIALCLPFGIGIVRCSRSLGVELAERALPPAGPDRLDLGLAARKALIVSLEVLMLAAVVLPVVAITQPLLPGWGYGRGGGRAVRGGRAVVLAQHDEPRRARARRGAGRDRGALAPERDARRRARRARRRAKAPAGARRARGDPPADRQRGDRQVARRPGPARRDRRHRPRDRAGDERRGGARPDRGLVRGRRAGGRRHAGVGRGGARAPLPHPGRRRALDSAVPTG